MANQSTHTPDLTKVITGPNTRILYPEVFRPVAFGGGKPAYSASLLIPKADHETLQAIRKAIEAAYDKDAAKYANELSAIAHDEIRSPLRDGDAEYPDSRLYAGCYFLRARSYKAPRLLDRQLKTITDPEAIYSGCYGRASLRISFYCHDGRAGFSCWLNGLQKTADGEKLGTDSVADDFAAAIAKSNAKAISAEEDIPF